MYGGRAARRTLKIPTRREIRLSGHFHDRAFQEQDPTGYRKFVTSVMRDDFTSSPMISLCIRERNWKLQNKKGGSEDTGNIGKGRDHFDTVSLPM